MHQRVIIVHIGRDGGDGWMVVEEKAHSCGFIIEEIEAQWDVHDEEEEKRALGKGSAEREGNGIGFSLDS